MIVIYIIVVVTDLLHFLAIIAEVLIMVV